MPTEALDPGWWSRMAEIFGSGGLVLLITNAAFGYLIYLMWKRLKEKDTECQTEMLNAESRWEVRFQQLRSDVKEAFGIVGELTKQTTLLAERSVSTRTRSD